GEAFEDFGAMAEMIDRGADIGPHRKPDEGGVVLHQVGLQEGLHGGPDAVDDGTEVARATRLGALQFVDCGPDRSAVRMAHDHDEARPGDFGGVLDAADLRGGDDVPGDADHEEIPESLIEHDLGGHAGVRTAEDDREGLLSLDQLAAPRRATETVCLTRQIPGEPEIAFTETTEGFLRTNHTRAY